MNATWMMAMLKRHRAEISIGLFVAGFLSFAFSLYSYKPVPTAQGRMMENLKASAPK